MARRRGRFRRRSSSPLPTGSFDHGCRVWKRSARTSVHVLSVAHGHARSSLKRSVPIEDGGDSFLSRKIFFAKLWQRFVKVACDFLLERPQTFKPIGSIVVRGSRVFFLSLFFFSLSPQFFRLQPSRAPLEDIENNQETHNSADKARQTKSAKRFFSLSSNKAIPFSRISLSLSFSLYIYTYIYRRGVNPTNYRPFSNQRLRSSFVKSVNREISLSS